MCGAAHRSITVSGNGMDRFERAFRFRSNGMERNENVTIFLTPTVYWFESRLGQIFTTSLFFTKNGR